MDADRLRTGQPRSFNAGLSTCDDGQPTLPDNLNDLGHCTIVFSSATAGTTTVNVSVTLDVGGVTIDSRRPTPRRPRPRRPGRHRPRRRRTGSPGATLLIIDEDSIDNGIHFNDGGGLITPSGPDFFANRDVNDDQPGTRQRDVLRYFAATTSATRSRSRRGRPATKDGSRRPASRRSGSTARATPCLDGRRRARPGSSNYFGANGSARSRRRAGSTRSRRSCRCGRSASTRSIGKNICAVVYDSDISINYDKKQLPVHGREPAGRDARRHRLHGDPGSDAQRVLEQHASAGHAQDRRRRPDATRRTLFNAPVPESSSVPNDRLVPPSTSGYRQLKTFPNDPLFF